MTFLKFAGFSWITARHVFLEEHRQRISELMIMAPESVGEFIDQVAARRRGDDLWYCELVSFAEGLAMCCVVWC